MNAPADVEGSFIPSARATETGDVSALLHVIRWVPAPASVQVTVPADILARASGGPNQGHWRLSGDAGVAARLRAMGFAASGGPCRGAILWLAGLGAAVASDQAAEPTEFEPVMKLIEWLRHLPDEPVRTWVVTQGAQAVIAGQDVRPGQAAVRGIARVAMSEHPDRRLTLIDLDPAIDDGDLLAAQLAAELVTDHQEDEVAWRDGERLVARLAAARPTDARAGRPRAEWAVRPDGGYVVTGRLDGLGIETVRWLAGSGARRIVVVDGARPSPDAARVLDEAQTTTGTEIEIVRGDVAEAGVAERAVAAAVAGTTPLRGVVHAAGVLTDGLIVGIDADQLEQVWRPKARGAWRMHEASAAHDLDWFVLFSSVAALVGEPGRGSYAAANAWLDGFAAWRRARGLPATSVAWAGSDSSCVSGRLAPGRTAVLAVDEVFTTLEAILRRDLAQVGVLPVPSELLDGRSGAARSSFFAGRNPDES